MDFKNFFLRFLLSLLIFLLYIIVSINHFSLFFYIGIFLYSIIFIEILYNFKKFKFYLSLYILLSFIFFININFKEIDIIFFHLMIISIVSFDTFSYIIGSIFGKNKIFKFISPNKTYEGFVGGVFFSLILSLLFIYFANIKFDYYFILYIFIIILSAFSGDIIESFFKRKNNLKDSSNLIPGHGGFLDRLDSYILSIVPYSIYSNII